MQRGATGARRGERQCGLAGLEVREQALRDLELRALEGRGRVGHRRVGAGGNSEGVEACAREICRGWAACQDVELYDDVADVMGELAASGVRIGLVSNSHRCLASFQTHFELQGLISATVSSSDHGMMKPHPSIFRAALELMDVPPAEAMMVGDSVPHDIEGALRVGMGGAVVARGARGPVTWERGQRVIESLKMAQQIHLLQICLLYTSPSPRDRTRYRMPASA